MVRKTTVISSVFRFMLIFTSGLVYDFSLHLSSGGN